MQCWTPTCFARACSNGTVPPNIIEADFTRIPPDRQDVDPMQLTMADRDRVENAEGLRLAQELSRRLPRTQDDYAALLESGYELGKKLDWDQVVKQCFLPAIHRMTKAEEMEEEAEQPAGPQIRLTG